MNEQYVISIKARNDVFGKPTEEWRYATIDRSSDHPDWAFSIYDCKVFTSVESAEVWFNRVKECLFYSHYDRYNFDMSTLAIRKIVYKKYLPLTV